MKTLHNPNTVNPISLIPVDPKIENYMRGLVSGGDNSVLIDMEQEAKEHNFPIVGRLVGVFLESLVKMVAAERVFEFGSGYGYSAYFFAKAMSAAGKVICTEGNPNNKIKAQQYLSRANLWQQIEFHTGFAQTVFAQTPGEFDICYNDVDKGDYPEVWQMAKSRIRPGGLYIADNVLWHGRVAVDDYIDVMPGWTEAILAHNQMIFNDPDFDAFINPTRDGVLVARRKTA